MKRTLVWGFPVAVAAALSVAGLVGAQDDRPAQSDMQHFRAKQVIGAKVSLDQSGSVGVVDDIVFDDNGNVDYLIVANSDRKLVTVPWDAAMFNVEKRTAVIHITPQKFQAIPTYTAERYPVFSTPAYRTEIYGYYGLTPGQQRRAIRRGAVVAP